MPRPGPASRSPWRCRPSLDWPATGETWLTVRAELARRRALGAGRSRGGPRAVRARPSRTATRRPPAPSAPARPDHRRRAGPDRPGPGRRSTPRTGRLRRLYDLDVAGPRFELWRGPTDNDRGDTRGSFELGAPEDTGGEGAPGPSSEQRWRERGLDRLVHRVARARHDRRPGAVRVAPGAGGRRAARSSTSATSGGSPTGDWTAVASNHPVAGLGLHLAAGRVRFDLPVEPRPGGVVRHRAAGVLSGFGHRRPASGSSRRRSTS